MRTLAIAKSSSGNAKLGDAATTHAAQASCPRSCRFLDGGGCYAETGRQGKFVTTPLNELAGELEATALARRVDEARQVVAVHEGNLAVARQELRDALEALDAETAALRSAAG